MSGQGPEARYQAMRYHAKHSASEPPDDDRHVADGEGESGQDTLCRVSEPAVMDVLRAFSLRDFMLNSVAYYRARPSAFRDEVLSGVTLALIEVPESVAFAFMAGVDPFFGMAAVFWIGTITGLFGGRPAMISGAAGAMAVVLGDLTKEDGPLGSFTREERVEQLLMCVFLTGCLEVLAGPLVAAFVKVIPQSAMIGFMDALAIIISKAQLESFQVCTAPGVLFNDCPSSQKAWLGLSEGRTWCFLALVALTMLLMSFLPHLGRFGRMVPASLVAIVLGTGIEWGIFRPLLHSPTRTVGETAALGSGLPGFHWPDLPPSPAWSVIWSYAASLCMIGLIETVMTHEVVNSIVKDHPDSFASNQGIANMMCGMFGAIGGSALIGETVINVLHGAKGRLSSTTAGLTMLAILEGLSPAVGLMPVATLAGVIFSVAVHTMQWRNLTRLHQLPRHDAVIIVVVAVLSVLTNLAIGVVAGVALSSLWHVWSSGRELHAKSSLLTGAAAQGGLGPCKVYRLFGAPLFFGSCRPLLRLFDYDNDPPHIVVDLSDTSITDLSGVTALNEVGKRYHETGGKTVTVVGLDEASRAVVRRCPGHSSHLLIDGIHELAEKEPHAGPLGSESIIVEGGIEVGLEMGLGEQDRSRLSAGDSDRD